MRAIFGILLLLVLCWSVSENRRAIPWRTVASGLVLQWVLAVLLLYAPPARAGILLLNRGVGALQRATDAGTGFVFGYLGGGALPFVESHPGASFVLAFKILPLVLVISALSSLLLYWGILQRVTAAFAWVLRRSLGLGGALSLGAAVHVFLGMVEAPLLIRPYLARMQRGELFALMSCGMAGVAGTVMVLYATILRPVLPDALGAILIASVISTPAALAVAAMMVPFSGGESSAEITVHERPASSLDALVRGTADGVGPLVGIATTLLVAVALVTLVNLALGHLTGGWTLEQLFALPFRPVVWLIGVPWRESGTAALLMGTKTVLNELVAYVRLSQLPADALSAKSRLIITFAMCGFANFGSLGILVGGMGAMVPERRGEITALGLRSILSGTVATCLSGAVAGLLG
ncbi:MAG TPA: nucleoside transporter C-terminal domain-containing protein [Acetobacteraceae bacterium]|nr:nucleoside transporter C-terminal domain-containing protein [Acetobacteraceae bacterium]